LVRLRRIGHCDLPFDLAQGGGELVEPFGICVLLFVIAYMKLHHLLQKCSFFLIKLAAFLASGAACMKLQYQSFFSD
jgi:hypothetical protein